MTYQKKIVLFTLLFIGLAMSFSTFLMYQPSNFTIFDSMKLDDYEFIVLWIHPILFYISGLSILILLMGFFILIFIPMRSKKIINKKKYVKTIIETKAIESLILLEIKKNVSIEKPKVKVKVFKKNIKIRGSISGLVTSNNNLVFDTEKFMKNTIESTSNMFEIPEKSIRLKLLLKDNKKIENKKKKSSRVH